MQTQRIVNNAALVILGGRTSLIIVRPQPSASVRIPSAFRPLSVQVLWFVRPLGARTLYIRHNDIETTLK